jgi:hypothetical protein
MEADGQLEARIRAAALSVDPLDPGALVALAGRRKRNRRRAAVAGLAATAAVGIVAAVASLNPSGTTVIVGDTPPAVTAPPPVTNADGLSMQLSSSTATPGEVLTRTIKGVKAPFDQTPTYMLLQTWTGARWQSVYLAFLDKSNPRDVRYSPGLNLTADALIVEPFQFRVPQGLRPGVYRLEQTLIASQPYRQETVYGQLVVVAPDHAAVEVSLQFAASQFAAGPIIRGEAIVTNTTRQTITVKDCRANDWPIFALARAGTNITSGPAIDGVGCPSQADIRLKPGPNRFPISLLTTYDICQPEATAQAPKCGPDNQVPLLPAGSYHTKSFIDGLPGQDVHVDEVTLTLTLTHQPDTELASACQTANLTGRETSSGSTASQPYVIIAVTNHGPSCTIDGYPRIISASGHSYPHGPIEQLPLAIVNGADYEHPDPGARPVTLAPGGAASFAFGTNTASGPLFTISALNMTTPGSSSPLQVAVNDTASARTNTPIGGEVTAFVEGSSGPPTG